MAAWNAVATCGPRSGAYCSRADRRSSSGRARPTPIGGPMLGFAARVASTNHAIHGQSHAGSTCA
eukprot:12900246-Alexandrium_andersonii.AAC.1